MAGTGRPVSGTGWQSYLLLILAVAFVAIFCWRGLNSPHEKATTQPLSAAAQQRLQSLQFQDLIQTKRGSVYMVLYLHDDRTLARVTPCEWCESQELFWDATMLADEAVQIVHKGAPEYPKLYQQWLNIPKE